MKKIKLTQNKWALVDDEDFEWLSQWRWCYDGMYAARKSRNENTNKQYTIRMHRLIIDVPKDRIADHINRNRLDNRRSNLRICTYKENAVNRKIQLDNKSGYKGVIWHKGAKKWMAYICPNSRFEYLGLFVKLEDAASAYNMSAKKYFGSFAKLNEIED